MGACCLVAVGSAEDLEPSAASAAPGTSSLAVSAFAAPAWDGPTALAASTPPKRWNRPGSRPVPRSTWNRGPNGWLTLRGGVFDTDGVSNDDWLVGMKATGRISQHLEFGISSDYQRRDDAERIRTAEYRDASGNLVSTTVTTFESSSTLIPIMGVLEAKVPTAGIQPYFGFGAGWEVLIVEGDDFANNTHFSDTFDGFGWQGWVGMAFPLNPRTKIVGEGYWNHSNVDRKIYDPYFGASVKQEIDVDGGGIRGGLSFGF